MAWTTIAEGKTPGTVKATIQNITIPKGVPVRCVYDLQVPIAYLANIAGAEQAMRAKLPAGLVLKDVHAEGNSRIVAECVVDPLPVLAIIAYAVGVAIILAGIGVFITFLRVEAPDDVIQQLLAEAAEATQKTIIVVAAIAGAILIAVIMIAWEGGLGAPGFELGKGE